MPKETYVLTVEGNAVVDAMLNKSRGGRGHKSGNKYERLTVTMPPELLERLDAFAARRNLSRSEALVQLVGTGFKFTREKKQS